MKRILVATDASEYSRRALEVGLEFARKFEASIELLFVMQMPLVYDLSVNFTFEPEQVEKEGDFALEATLKGIDINGVNLIQKKMHGTKAADVILQEIENENIDLVVMGSHGYGAIAGTLLGSVSQNVLHNAKCAVLIVK